jgi:hypothetical protein
MTEPIIKCPHCSTEIKLTESLAAPLVQAARKEYEAKISAKEAEVSKREEELRTQQKNIAKAQKAIDEQVTEKLAIERKVIVAEEAIRAKLVAASDLDARLIELARLQKILQQAKISAKEAEVSKCEEELRTQQKNIAKAQQSIDEQVTKKLDIERTTIVAKEAKKAKLVAASDLDARLIERAS